MKLHDSETLKTYNKLVRDKIPDIISQDGKKAVSHILSEKDYIAELDKKLIEEVNEYLKDKNMEEMADVLEVLYAVCKARGYTINELEAKRKEKAEERGGFQEKIFLEQVDEGNPSKSNQISDIKALKKWSQIPEPVKEKLIHNVFCSSCGVTTILDYSIHHDSIGIILKGICFKCGRDVARIIEQIAVYPKTPKNITGAKP